MTELRFERLIKLVALRRLRFSDEVKQVLVIVSTQEADRTDCTIEQVLELLDDAFGFVKRVLALRYGELRLRLVRHRIVDRLGADVREPRVASMPIAATTLSMSDTLARAWRTASATFDLC